MYNYRNLVCHKTKEEPKLDIYRLLKKWGEWCNQKLELLTGSGNERDVRNLGSRVNNMSYKIFLIIKRRFIVLEKREKEKSNLDKSSHEHLQVVLRTHTYITKHGKRLKEPHLKGWQLLKFDSDPTLTCTQTFSTCVNQERSTMFGRGYIGT